MIAAAPFLGEFGWEVAMWTPWLRWERLEIHRQADFVVLCRRGHEELYKDFATEVIGCHALPEIIRVDCNHAFVKGHGRFSDDDYRRMTWANLAMKKMKPKKGDILVPAQINYRWPETKPPFLRQGVHTYYGTPTKKEKCWVALHARACLGKQPERNWPFRHWDRLVESLKEHHIVCVGSKSDSYAPKGTEDLRGLPLSDIVVALSKCEVGIGPSSGPMHLMNACGTPVVWWSGNEKDQERYESAWNYHSLPNQRVEMSWSPTVESVLECLAKIFSSPA